MTKLLTLLLIAFLSVSFFASCGNQTPAPMNADVAIQPLTSLNLDSMKKVIEEKDNIFTKAFVGLDGVTPGASCVVNAYTSDARLFPPNADMVAGQQAIGAVVAQYFKYGIKEFRDSTTSLYGNEENLIEEGVLFMGDGKGHVIDKGKYLAVWRKDKGEWKIYSDIWNTSLPPATAKK